MDEDLAPRRLTETIVVESQEAVVDAVVPCNVSESSADSCPCRYDVPAEGLGAASQLRRTELWTDITDRDAGQRFVGLHVPYLHDKSVRAIVLQTIASAE